MAKIYLYSENLEDAEQLLIILLNKNPLHINALRLIVELQEQMKKNKTEQMKYLNKLYNIFPDDITIKEKILVLDKESLKNEDKKQKKKNSVNEINKPLDVDFNINHNMATLTFVEILKPHSAETPDG